MSRTKVAYALIAVLVVFCAVQTYRVHELGLRLSSLSSSVSVTDHPVALRIDRGGQPAVREEHQAPASAKPEAPREPAAASNTEALLNRERERVRTIMANTSSKPASETPEGTRKTEPQAPAHRTPDASGEKDASKQTDNKANKDMATDRKQAKTLAGNEVLIRAQGAVEKGTYDDAVAILKQGLQDDPTSRNLNVMLAGLYHRLRQYDAELQTYLDWSAQSPGDAFPHYEAAQTYAILGRSPEALQELSHFLDATQQVNKEDMSVYPMVASIYHSLGMSANEGAVLQTWAQQAPDQLDVRYALADYYSRTGDNQAALAEYQGIAQRVPMNADAHRNLANAYRRINMNQEAESEFTTAISLQPQNMYTRLQLADLYRQKQQLDAALQTYAEIVAAVPNAPEGQQAQQMIAQVQAQIRASTPPPK